MITDSGFDESTKNQIPCAHLHLEYWMLSIALKWFSKVWFDLVLRWHQVRSEEWVHHTLLESPHQWILVQNSSGISSYPAALAASGHEIDAQTINKPQKQTKKEHGCMHYSLV